MNDLLDLWILTVSSFVKVVKMKDSDGSIKSTAT